MSKITHQNAKACFACMFDDYLWKSYVYRTTFSNVKYQDLCATINLSKIKYLQNHNLAIKSFSNRPISMVL